MIRPELNEYSIAKGVRAFSSTRRGGVSNGPFRAFNINAFCGDDPASVAENRKALAAELGISADHIVMPHQIHGTECLQIDETWLAYTAAQRCQKAKGYDAVMTRLRGVCIGVSTADCIPLLLYDAEHDAIAAVHAGWRGTVKRIAEHTIRRMQQAYGTQPSGLQAVIGPGISLEAFEVGNEVYEAFRAEGFDMEAIACRFSKWHIDLPTCNRLQLLAAGLQTDRIQMADCCTFSHTDEYFSARKLGLKSGRIFTGIMQTE